jgi:hypothetical protein
MQVHENERKLKHDARIAMFESLKKKEKKKQDDKRRKKVKERKEFKEKEMVKRIEEARAELTDNVAKCVRKSAKDKTLSKEE